MAGPDHATPRLAVAAPWWALIAAAIVAALVPAFRRRPGTAVPALLSTVAWWPVPLPPILWLSSPGPLAWLPIAASVGLAVGAAPLAAVGRAIGADRPGARRGWPPLATLVHGHQRRRRGRPRRKRQAATSRTTSSSRRACSRTATSRSRTTTASATTRPTLGGHLDPHYIVPGKNGQIYSVHAPGVSALVLPGVRTASATTAPRRP